MERFGRRTGMRPVSKHIGSGRRFPNHWRSIHAEHSLDGVRRWCSVHPFVGGQRPDPPGPRQGPADGPGTFKGPPASAGVRARGFRLRTVTRGPPTRAPRATTAAGMPAARPAIPAGTTSAGPATTRAASAGRGPGWGCGPAWASAASARGADRPQVLRSPCGGARPGDGRRGR